MNIDSIAFRGYRCFGGSWTEFEQIKSINVIIGRNNSGKSQMVDIVESLCGEQPYRKEVEFRCHGILDEASLKRSFQPNTSGGELGGNHWQDHGAKFVNKSITWEVNSSGQVTTMDWSISESADWARAKEARKSHLRDIALRAKHCLTGKRFRRLRADRDIRPEPADIQLELKEDGAGATNLIRRFIVSSSPRLPREAIQKTLLSALTSIFASDGQFSEIQIQIHDEKDAGYPDGYWEIYLGESAKGLVSLSRSGSGLKTVILVLLNLLIIPEIENSPKSSYVFTFEELENNLHPALLRRLFQYLEDYVRKERATIFLTTHSSVALDFFGVSKNAQLIHIVHDGTSATGQVVSSHFDHLGVVSELGAKPSDLLQANGIIWVEGPSDCIYINRWINLFSNGSLQEGRDYQCAFYGGSLLARTQFVTPEDAEKELVNLFRINPNIIVICDGDRSSPNTRIKDRVRRINSEVKAITGSCMWITRGREIENYLPGDVLASALGIASLPDPEQYELFFPRKGATAGSSYVEAKMQRRGIDKVELAIQTTPNMTKENLVGRFDLAEQLNAIVSTIQKWNA